MRALLSLSALLLLGCGPEPTVRSVSVPDAMGLHAGDPVRAAGVDVGRVRSVRLRGGAAEIVFAVRYDVDLVTEEHCAAVEARGLVGDAMLVLRPADVDLLPARGTVTACDESPALADATAPLVSAATALAEYMESAAHGDGILARLATDEVLADRLETFLERTDDTPAPAGDPAPAPE